MMLRIEEEARRARELLRKPEVIEAMRIRCEEQGHERGTELLEVPGLTPFLQVVLICKWCGDRR